MAAWEEVQKFFRLLLEEERVYSIKRLRDQIQIDEKHFLSFSPAFLHPTLCALSATIASTFARRIVIALRDCVLRDQRSQRLSKPLISRNAPHA
jgi:hypothetical protein